MVTVDYRKPEYSAIYAQRSERLLKLKESPELLAALKVYYRDKPWAFIADWGFTFEPRNIERNLLAVIPFVPWARQVEFLQWLYGQWRAGERGLVEKSRDCGVTWLAVGFAVSMMLFEPGFTTGFGSRKEELVDKIGDSKSIFEKLRFFLANIPPMFLPARWDWKTCSAYMRLVNPETGAGIIGEAGDNIGRGGRTSVYLVDEAAFIEHQNLVDAALSQNTNCQIDISTVNGSGNEFYKKRMRYDNTAKIFIFDWRDDPRKSDTWYQKQVAELDPIIVAQEIDRDYNASSEDSFIPAKWIASAIDAHLLLGFEPSGLRSTGFDPADVGDAKAAVNRHGSVITEADQLKSGDITHAMPWAFRFADNHRADVLSYDGDGMGSPAMKLTLTTMSAGRMKVIPYHGSGAVEDPDGKHVSAKQRALGIDDTDLKTNGDTFANYRAQSWTWLRERFELTHEAVQRAKAGKIVKADPEDLISISSECKCRIQLQAELSRPKRVFTNNGKILVESKKDMKKRGVESPNLADATVIAMATRKTEQARKPLPLNVRPMRDQMRI